MNDMTIPGVPFAATWAVPPALAWSEGETLHVEATARSDIFTNPSTGEVRANSPRLMFAPPDTQFAFSAHVSVNFASTFDAGVLLLWVDGDYWAKLCFEYSPQGEPMIVSVVNNGVSDDCNSVPISRNHIYLRMTRLEPGFAFHYSEDGEYWRLVRHFTLQRRAPLTVGLSAQAPFAERCTVTFDSVRYSTAVVTDIRSGA